MPILPPQNDLFPADLFDSSAILPADGRWLAFYTLPRREKDLMRRLEQMRIPFYGPLVARRNRSPSGRARTSYVPLFPAYVFVHADEPTRHEAMKTGCIARWLEVPDSRGLLVDLAQIHRLIGAGAALTPEARIEPGDRVRVRSGPFAGLEGTVLKRRGGDRLLVVVRFLQQGASVELEDYQVEPL